MAIDWAAAKNRTEVIVPWLTIFGLVSAGVFTIVEYRSKQDDDRIALTMQYVSRFMDPPLSDHRVALSKAWNANEVNILGVLRDKTLDQKALGHAYRDTILKIVSADSLQLPIQEQLLYFEQLNECVRLGLCDDGVARTTLGLRAREFFRQFYPYICALRSDWNDPTIGAALEAFGRSGPRTVDVCAP